MHVIPTNERSKIFEIIMSVVPMYETALLNSKVSLIHKYHLESYYIMNCSSFTTRNCDAEFSQIFTGIIFNTLSCEEKLLFETSYSVPETYSQCNHCNQGNSAVTVSCNSVVELSNCNDLADCIEVLSPNNQDTNKRCTKCVKLMKVNL